MFAMFNGAAAFDQPLDWDTSKVTNMQGMFRGAAAFDGSPSDWDTSKVTTMFDMFRGATSFDQPLDWDTSKVTQHARDVPRRHILRRQPLRLGHLEGHQ